MWKHSSKSSQLGLAARCAAGAYEVWVKQQVVGRSTLRGLLRV